MFISRLFLHPVLLPTSPPFSHPIITDGILPMKTNHITLQWLHLIFMCRTAPWNICGCTALLLLSIPPPLYLFSSLSFPIFDINEFEASILSPGCPSLISPLTLPLVHSHQPEAGGSPGPHPSYCHPCIPCLSCSPCQLDSSSP